MKNLENIKLSFGIDSLYYFCESNLDYDHLYLDIIDQFETIKGNFVKKDIKYESNDIEINIKNTTLTYQGRSEGFIYFRDKNNFFRIGFKDTTKNKNLHDIRVELLAIGIYTIGINPLLKYVDTILDGYITGLKPITRADLNCFAQYDFGFVNKSMFATRKRVYVEYCTHGNANRTETIYVGKKPFMLRLYDKTLEMKRSKKQELMREYFLNNGFEINKTISNIEFEMHRSHLKSYNLLTVEDVLANANNLFKSAMDEIRLININEVSQNDTKLKNKNRASTLSIWDYIQYNYDVKEFLQIDTPLERIERIEYKYTYAKFIAEMIVLLRKAYVHSLPIKKDTFKDILDELLDSLKEEDPYRNAPIYKEIGIEVISNEKPNSRFILLKNGDIMKPMNEINVSTFTDDQIINYISDILSESHVKKVPTKKYKIAHKELIKRGLDMPNKIKG